MKYGFIGTGTITEAIVTGLMASSLEIESILLSPRNAKRAQALADRFNQVSVAQDNQAVVDGSEVLILAVRRQIAEQVLCAIRIPRSTTIISLIASTTQASLSNWTGHDEAQIVRADPLPFVATGDGATAVFPPDQQAATLFDALGKAVLCKTEEEFDLLAAATSLMGTYFGILERSNAWLVSNGIDEESGRVFLAKLFGNLADVTARSPDASFEQLRHEFSTPGGTNEQVFTDFEASGGTRALMDALNRVK